MHFRIPNPALIKRLVLIAAADVAYFSLVDPRTGNVLILVVACALVCISVYAACRMVMWFIAKILHISGAAQVRASLSAAIGIAFLVLMQSIGQLSARDILAVVPLVLVAYFYMAYTSTAHNKNFETRA